MSRRPFFVALVATFAASVLTTAAPEVQLARALSAQQQLVAEHPDDPAVLNDLGNLQLRAGLLDQAAASYRQALESDSTAVTPRFNLALLLQQQGEPRKALKELDRVVEGAPNHARAHYQRGVLLEARGSRSAAIRAYAAAFRLDPQLTMAKVNPQIIDSQLTVQALLAAFGDQPVSVEAPRVYQNPDQVYQLLTEPAAAPADAPSEPKAAPPAATGVDEAATAPPGSGRRGRGTARERQARVLGPDELQDVNRAGGQASPASGSDRPRQSSYATSMSRRLSASSRTPSAAATAPPTRAAPTTPQAAGATSGYRPSRLSTGRLEIELFETPAPASRPS